VIVDTLSVEGWLGYTRRSELKLGAGAIGIVGQNEVGKSSLLLAITYGIYGRIPFAVGDAALDALLSDYGEGAMEVHERLLLQSGESLEITRGRTRKGKGVLKIEGCGETSPSKLQHHIDDAVRLTFSDFCALSFFVQGDMHEFMAGDKRPYFERWTSQLGFWRAVEKRANGRLKVTERELAQLAREREVRQRELDGVGELKRELLVVRQAALRKKRELGEANTQVERLAAKLERTRSADDRGATLASIDAQRQPHQTALRRDRKRMDEALRQIKQVADGTCPLLNIACKPLRASGADERRRLNTEIGECRASIVTAQAEVQRLDARQKRVEKKGASEAWEVEEELRTARASVTATSRELQAAMKRQAYIEAQLEQARNAAARLKEIDTEIKECERLLGRARFVSYMCGPQGIPSELIEDELQRVEDRCNWVLKRLDYGKRIRFSGYRELAGFERICGICGGETWYRQQCKGCGAERPRRRKYEPTVTVVDGAQERPFALESGGARTLQSFAVRLAGGLFVSRMTGIPMRMVMLDEVFAHLDADNRQKLMSLIVDKLRTEFALEQQLIVSHHADIIGAADRLIRVERSGDGSVAREED
jgi:DNA repair exonuclease SbcCD ATPase subunit